MFFRDADRPCVHLGQKVSANKVVACTVCRLRSSRSGVEPAWVYRRSCAIRLLCRETYGIPPFGVKKHYFPKVARPRKAWAATSTAHRGFLRFRPIGLTLRISQDDHTASIDTG